MSAVRDGSVCPRGNEAVGREEREEGALQRTLSQAVGAPAPCPMHVALLDR